jgi:signal transduction histidine kinase
VAQRTAVVGSHRLGRQTLLLLDVRFVALLVHCLLAAWTLFVVLTVGALSHLVGCQRTYLNSLSALSADAQHGAGVEVVQIFVVLLYETFVHSFAEFASYCLVVLVDRVATAFLGDLDEFVAHV